MKHDELGQGPRPVIVAGSRGALGQELGRQLDASGLTVLRLDRSNLDIAQGVSSLIALLERARPRAVINCLAMTGLDRCRGTPSQAFEANGLFPCKLAIASRILGLAVVQFSTEAVFPCNINELTYREPDNPGPTTVYGWSKLLGEAADLRANTRFHVVRLPLLYGPTNNQQAVARLLKELLEGRDVAVASDVYSTPVYTPDVAGVIVNWLKGDASLGSVTHLTSGHRRSMHELLSSIARASGAKGRINVGHSKQFPSAEDRPLHGGLSSDTADRLPWESAIERYAAWIKTNPRVVASQRT